MNARLLVLLPKYNIEGGIYLYVCFKVMYKIKLNTNVVVVVVLESK